jgi:hypothetical protein
MTQNYNTAAKSPNTLSINTTVTLHDVVKLQIELPYFCKDNSGAYFSVESPTKTTRVKHYESINVVDVQSGPTGQYEASIAQATAVTEDEFKNILTYAMTYIMSDKAA